MVAPPYFDVPPQAYGGIEAVLADLSNALVDLGHTVTMIGAGRDEHIVGQPRRCAVQGQDRHQALQLLVVSC